MTDLDGFGLVELTQALCRQIAEYVPHDSYHVPSLQVAHACWSIRKRLEHVFEGEQCSGRPHLDEFNGHALAEAVRFLREARARLAGNEPGGEYTLGQWVDSLLTWYLDPMLDPEHPARMRLIDPQTLPAAE